MKWKEGCQAAGGHRRRRGQKRVLHSSLLYSVNSREGAESTIIIDITTGTCIFIS
jgi:hypothetical protein